MKLTEARKRILAELDRHGEWERIDALRCFADATSFQLWRLRSRGLIGKRRFPGHSIWRSCQHLPFYQITEAGRTALKEQEQGR